LVEVDKPAAVMSAFMFSRNSVIEDPPFQAPETLVPTFEDTLARVKLVSMLNGVGGCANDDMRGGNRWIRMQQHHAKENERKVALLRTMITDFDNTIADLDEQIASRREPHKHQGNRPPCLFILCQGGEQTASELAYFTNGREINP